MANPNAASVQAITAAAQKYGIDPKAMIAVARVESGLNPKAIGDGGHAFGLFQFNNAGGVITGDPNPGKYLNPSYNALAAARHIATIKGIHNASGSDAIKLIVNGFERPANKAAEIAKATAYLGDGAGITAPTVGNGSVGPRQTAPNGSLSTLGTTGSVNNNGAQNALENLIRYTMSGSSPSHSPGNDNNSNDLLGLLTMPQDDGMPSPTVGTTAAVPTMTMDNTNVTNPLVGKAVDLKNPKIIGTPYQGTHGKSFNRSGGSDNWQSENAVDIAMPKGTPVYATESGTIGNRIGSLGSGGRFAGLRVNLQGSDNAFYYAHLSKLAVSAGEKVKAGQLIGYSGVANGVAHLHLATEKGSPNKYA